MGKRDAACRNCGRPSQVMAERAAMKARAAPGVAFLGKSMRPLCPRCGNVSRAMAPHCTGCGSALLQVVKSLAEIDRDRNLAQFYRELKGRDRVRQRCAESVSGLSRL
jgi:hypothetical protein